MERVNIKTMEIKPERRKTSRLNSEPIVEKAETRGSHIRKIVRDELNTQRNLFRFKGKRMKLAFDYWAEELVS